MLCPQSGVSDAPASGVEVAASASDSSGGVADASFFSRSSTSSLAHMGFFH
jgi:hypothetical protein